MRRMRKTFIALSVVTVMSLLPAASALASGGSPRLIAGTLRDGAGRVSSGRVLVFHDNLRDADRMELLGYAKANGNGQFKFHLGHDARVDAARSRNDGYGNFAMYAVTDSGVSRLSFFTAKLAANGGAWTNQSKSLDKASLKTNEKLPSTGFAANVARFLDGHTTTTTGGGIVAQAVTGDQWLDFCVYDKIQTWDEQTPVMELHSYYTDLKGVARYARGNVSDSDVSVGVKYSGWSLEGTTHIGNSDEVVVSKTANGAYGAILGSSFRYSRWKFAADNYFVCAVPPDPMYVVEAVRWNGTNMSAMWTDTGQDGKCTTTYNSYKNPMDRGDTWSRSSYRLTTFGWTVDGATGVSVNMRSTSGSSSRVTFDYTAGTARSRYYICGNDDYPAYSHRIFAGN